MNPLRLRAASLIVGALILANACGSGNPSPAAPSPTESNTQAPGPTPSSSGATVSGTVTDGASGQARVYALASSKNG